MKNLAGRPNATTDAVEELRVAGIPTVPSPRPDGETKASLDGELRAGPYLFRFVRGWAYWRVACSPRLPVELVLQLNAAPCEGQGTHYSGQPGVLGGVARAHGFAGGMGEQQIQEWGPCDSWHIDTPEGLKAFAAWCVSTLGPATAPPAPPPEEKGCGCVHPHPHRAWELVAKPWCSTCGGTGVKP